MKLFDLARVVSALIQLQLSLCCYRGRILFSLMVTMLLKL